MELPAPLTPQMEQTRGIRRVAQEDRREAGWISLYGIEPILFDVLDDARRLLAADFEEIGQLAPAAAFFLSNLLKSQAETIGSCLALLLFVAQPQFLQALQFLVVSAEHFACRGHILPRRHLQVTEPAHRRGLN